MAKSSWATLKTEYYYRHTFTIPDQVYIRTIHRSKASTAITTASTPASMASPSSNTNYTKRPG